MSIEAMKQARSVISSINSGRQHEIKKNGETVFWQREEWVRWALDEVLPLIDQAIAEAEKQEPVAEVTSETSAEITMSWWHEPALPIGTKLYTTPQQRTWVGLTDEEVEKIYRAVDGNEFPLDFYDEIEAKFKEKNT